MLKKKLLSFYISYSKLLNLIYFAYGFSERTHFYSLARDSQHEKTVSYHKKELTN